MNVRNINEKPEKKGDAREGTEEKGGKTDAAKKFGKEPRGGNNNDIIPADYDRLSGSTAFYGVTRIKIVKV